MSGRRALLLSAALGALQIGCSPRGGDPLDAAVRLSVWPPGGAEPHFEIAAEPCPGRCGFAVSLVDGERVRDHKRLDWASAVGAPTLGPVDASAGAGDPLDPDALEREASEALYTGDEASGVITVARGLTLGPGTAGLLVDQAAGVEQVKRAHFLFAVREGRLRRAWSYEEPDGPTWSSTAIAPLAPDRQGVVLLAVRALASEPDDRSDEVEPALVAWDADSGKVTVQSDVPIAAVAIGRFAGLAEARKAQEDHAECLVDFWLLPAERLSPAPEGARFSLALLGLSEPGARSRLSEALECTGDLAGAVARLRP